MHDITFDYYGVIFDFIIIIILIIITIIINNNIYNVIICNTIARNIHQPLVTLTPTLRPSSGFTTLGSFTL